MPHFFYKCRCKISLPLFYYFVLICVDVPSAIYPTTCVLYLCDNYCSVVYQLIIYHMPCICCLVSDLIPLLAMSPGLILEQPFLRSNGQSLILKTSHVCQWLEVAASYYTSLTVQALLSRKRKPLIGWQFASGYCTPLYLFLSQPPSLPLFFSRFHCLSKRILMPVLTAGRTSVKSSCLLLTSVAGWT